MVLAALRSGKPVVTANKALLSAHGEELFAAAAKSGANLYYEASVCGGIPIIKALREGFVGNRFTAHLRHRQRHLQLHPHPHEAGGRGFRRRAGRRAELGYAETPPDLDIDGYDAAAQDRHPRLAGARLLGGSPRRSTSRASAHISKLDMQFAEQLGYTIKLLGIVKTGRRAKSRRNGPGFRLSHARPQAHVLASVNGVFNAVFVRGDVVGDTLFYGRGAGKDATASAVLSDVADAALDLKHGSQSRVPAFVPHERDGARRADRRSGLALLRPPERRGQAGRDGEDHRHSWRGQDRHLLRHPAGRPRRRERAVDPDDPRRPQRRHAARRWPRSPSCPPSKAPPVMIRVESFE